MCVSVSVGVSAPCLTVWFDDQDKRRLLFRARSVRCMKPLFGTREEIPPKGQLLALAMAVSGVYIGPEIRAVL